MPFARYLARGRARAALARRHLRRRRRGRPGGTLGDVLRFGRELLAPTLVAPETLAEATSVQFPGLDGVLPGFGRQTPNDWGLGFELRDAKSPHWTGSLNSPATFGHFGSKPGSATFLWVDPERRLALRRARGRVVRRLGARGVAQALGRRAQRRKSSSSRLSSAGRSRLGRWPAPSIVSSLRARNLSSATRSRSRLDVGEVLGADDDERRHPSSPSRSLAGGSGQTAFDLSLDRAAAARRSGSPSPRSARARSARRASASHMRPCCGGGRSRSPRVERRFLLLEASATSSDHVPGRRAADQHQPLDELGALDRQLERDPRRRTSSRRRPPAARAARPRAPRT